MGYEADMPVQEVVGYIIEYDVDDHRHDELRSVVFFILSRNLSILDNSLPSFII